MMQVSIYLEGRSILLISRTAAFMDMDNGVQEAHSTYMTVGSKTTYKKFPHFIQSGS